MSADPAPRRGFLDRELPGLGKPLRLLTHHKRNDDDVEESERPLDWTLIRRMYHYTKPHSSLCNALMVTVLLRSLQLPLLTWAAALVIKGPIAGGDLVGAYWGVFGFFALALSTQVVMHYRQRYALELGERVVYDLRRDVFAHLQTLPMSFYHRTKLGRIISRFTSDVENVRAGVQEVFFVTLVQIGQMGVASCVMLWADAVLFGMMLGLATVLWFINRHFHRILSRLHRQVQESFSRVTATLAESVNGIRVTQGFVRQDVNAELFADLAYDHSRYSYRVVTTQGLFLPLLDLNSQGFLAVLLLAGGYRVLQPDSGVDLGDLVAFCFMSGMFFAPITTLGGQYNMALTAMAGAERVFRLLDTPPDWSDPSDAVELPRLQGHIEFQGVTFGYAAERPVLHDLNFVVEPGWTVALVGHTGSGKSSIVNLATKFYLPNQGTILLDGFDAARASSASLRRQMGL
ncbi:MAG: ABC transporter ATP-binding protein, partial [Planctomycetia bacterium]